MLMDHQDAYGHAMLDHLNGMGGLEIVERDDGYISCSGGPELYFMEYNDWQLYEQRAMEYVSGRVLDIGCGPGRHSLYLQGSGLDVTGIDISPLAIEVSKARGVKDTRVMSITRVSRKIGIYDTILMMGNNFGLFSNKKRARWMLRRFDSMTPADSRIIAQSLNPHQTDDQDHIAYHATNISMGRMAGQVRIRVRYKTYITPWFDYLMVSTQEMAEILHGTGWQMQEILGSGGANYIAVIGKVKV